MRKHIYEGIAAITGAAALGVSFAGVAAADPLDGGTGGVLGSSDDSNGNSPLGGIGDNGYGDNGYGRNGTGLFGFDMPSLDSLHTSAPGKGLRTDGVGNLLDGGATGGHVLDLPGL